MQHTDRRNFLKTTAGATASVNLLIRNSAGSVNDEILMGVVGIRGRGNNHIRGFDAQKNVKVVSISDIDGGLLRERKNIYKKDLGHDVKTYVDYRKMLEDPELDAVSIATPNHWHSIMGIWACQAGKHVYVEKPCSHNVYEGRKLVEAARKYKRIVAHGTQSRSCEALQEAIQLIRDGEIGDVYYAKGLCYKWRNTIGHTPDGKPPRGVDYDKWQGPAPEQPFSKNRFHYNWHWNWLYGNGDIGNQGVHEMDLARWGLDVGMPTTIQAQGGHFMFEDDQQTPNVLHATFKYPDKNKMMAFEVRHWHTNNELGEINGADGNDRNVVGCIFFGSEGYMTTHGFNRGYQVYLGEKREKGKGRRSGENHFENFITALRSNKQEDLNAEIIEGHISSAHCHLANAAYRTEETLRFDPKTERITNNEKADAIIRDQDRDYRMPFTVPDEV